MVVGANAHHSSYLQSAYFLRAQRLLMHDLDKLSDEAAKGLLRTDLNTKPASLNVRPGTLREEADQEASDELLTAQVESLWAVHPSSLFCLHPHGGKYFLDAKARHHNT